MHYRIFGKVADAGTPKNFLGTDKDGERLQGYALQGWFAPNITNNSPVGLGNWSVDDIASYLTTGHNKFSAATGPMSETLNLSIFQRL